MRYSIALFFLLCTGVWAAQAQGFKTFNGRNHPELDWQVAETEHFQVIYPRHLEGIEAEAGTIAEASYDALSANLKVHFDEKIRIYLSDEDEIANGFAQPIGTGHTLIWVHHNDWATLWTGREKWLRKVIAHELAHIFHYRAVQSGSLLLNATLGNPLPRFWTEGLAQYQTEDWDAHRGDLWLRTSVLDDQLSYNDGRSIWNGRLLYAVGNAQVRYFAQQYGDSTLTQLLGHRSPRLGGLVRVHDFNKAFKAVTGESYPDFYDTWRRHINIYYNTLAGQLETLDSLDAATLDLPGQYLYEARFSPDTTHLAVLSLASLDRPIPQLFVVDTQTRKTQVVAEGSIGAPISWRPDGRRLAFARKSRGYHGAVVNDLYLVDADGRNLQRLTKSRRASSPTFSPDGERLAFVGIEGGTANVFVMDLKTGQETPLTTFTGDVQISSLRWHPSDESLALAYIASDGTRQLLLLDATTGTHHPLTDGQHDDRLPVWSPQGDQLAYTSFRDEVPNVFVYDRTTQTHRRVTHLITGATAFDWLPPDTVHTAGSLLLISNVSKLHDKAVRVDAARMTQERTLTVPPAYAAWTWHRPPQEVQSLISPDPTLVTQRYPYSSWRNITHLASFALPYYNTGDDWGLWGMSIWTEPLGKHLFALGGNLAAPQPRDKSSFLASYVNSQWTPTLFVNAYRVPSVTQTYSNKILTEDAIGGDVSLQWPLGLSEQPFVSQWVMVGLNALSVKPTNAEDFSLAPFFRPEAGQQIDLTLTFQHRKLRPYRYNHVHPLDGQGISLKLKAAAKVFGTDSEFVRADLKAFTILPGLGKNRLYLYGRTQIQTGEPRAQDYIGFSRDDAIQIPIPVLVPNNADRVRGYRLFARGDRVFFGTAEYRIPLTRDLHTQLLGMISLESTALAAFVDGGMVWSTRNFAGRTERVGIGLEIKNGLRLGGLLEIGHALGIAQPLIQADQEEDYDLYYRLRAALPF